MISNTQGGVTLCPGQIYPGRFGTTGPQPTHVEFRDRAVHGSG
jgi:hypothetical protein